MASGRKRKSPEQKQREGNAGHRPIGASLRLTASAPTKPDDLPAAASKLWDTVVGALAAAGVASAIDEAALTALCMQWARSEQARGVLARDGLFALGSTGQLVEHPAVAIEKGGHQMFLRFAEQYGLTAAARARIAGAIDPRAPEEEDELADVLELVPQRG